MVLKPRFQLFSAVTNQRRNEMQHISHTLLNANILSTYDTFRNNKQAQPSAWPKDRHFTIVTFDFFCIQPEAGIASFYTLNPKLLLLMPQSVPDIQSESFHSYMLFLLCRLPTILQVRNSHKNTHPVLASGLVSRVFYPDQAHSWQCFLHVWN